LACGTPGDGSQLTAASDPLPSWNDGDVKQRILEFVDRVTDPAGPDFVPELERIATFDNDGTLWSEKPVYFQLLFAVDRVKDLAPEHPDWRDRQPFKGVLEGDLEAVAATGEQGLLELVLATHTGMTTAEFEEIVERWLVTARHPERDRPYTELVYQPMIEVLDYLRSHGFKTFITSGGGIEFMRPWVEEVYGIPPEQVVGSSVVSEFQIKDGKPVVVRVPKIDFINDKAGKPVGIYEHIGRRPILAFGNADADMQMVEYTMAGEGRRMALFVHHTDADREYAYDRKSHVGTLDKALDQADAKGWIIVDMKKDW
jgi:phosphoglycolate phosphatase-like HAD superfamily hydrolase